MEKLGNHLLEIKVSEHGAELQSIVRDGKEYLWQGNPVYWGRHSPVLFPIVGRVWNDVYRYKGGEYHIGQHGFARDMDFVLVSKTENSLRYRLESSPETLSRYPCAFRLEIEYRLVENAVEVLWKVENTGKEIMDFQIGAHPAFFFPDFDPDTKDRCFFSFDNPGELKYIVPAEKGCSGTEEYVLQRDTDGYMKVDTDTFSCDTYTFENGQLHKVTLCDKAKRPYVSLEFDAPLVALWSPTEAHRDCPFVCIEPWYGRCDKVGYNGEFQGREWMWSLKAGECFSAEYKIIIEL